MNVQSAIREQCSEAEWQTRVDLAACYRLVDMFGWSDLLGTHISARVPGEDDAFLINPYGLLFDEITASSLVKVDEEGNILSPKIVGDSVGLHPLWVFFALMAGGALFGVLGMLLAVPLAAAAGVLLAFAIKKYKASPFYEGSAKKPKTKSKAKPKTAEA